MASGGRERRAAKKRRRDERRGFDRGASAPRDRGLPPDALRRLLRETAADLAGGREEAETELRHLLVEHLARRRPEILAACDDVLTEAGYTARAEREDLSTEDAVVSTVRRLARLT